MTTRQHGDPKAEKDLLGLLINSPHLISEVSEVVSPSHFTGDRGKLVYEAMLALHGNGQILDFSLLCDELNSNGTLNKVGGRAEIAALAGRYTNDAFMGHLAGRIRAHAALRDLGAVASELLNESQSSKPEESSILDLVDKAQAKLSDIISSNKQDDVGEACTEIASVAEMLVKPRSSSMQGVPTGFLDLDDVLCGLRPGQLVLLAARSRVGKTSLACDIVRQAATDNRTVVFFSLEMTRQEIWERMISGQAGISLHDMRMREATDEEKNKVSYAASELASMSIIVKDTPNTTPLSMRGFSRKIISRKGKIDLIVVDYLQCIQSGKDRQSRYELVSDVSRQMKVLARTLNVPVLALAQLNRTAEDEEPRLSHLRESGGLEQDADVVLLLNRPHVFDSEKDPTLATVDIAKHRNGPCQMINLHFEAGSVSFRNRAPKIEDFSKVSQDSPVAPPRKKKTNWYENGQFD